MKLTKYLSIIGKCPQYKEEVASIISTMMMATTEEERQDIRQTVNELIADGKLPQIIH